MHFLLTSTLKMRWWWILLVILSTQINEKSWVYAGVVFLAIVPLHGSNELKMEEKETKWDFCACWFNYI
jgi:hypothetical protein